MDEIPSLGIEYTVEFDITVENLPSSTWANVFRFTNTDGDQPYGDHGDRIPALFINKNGYGYLLTSFGTDPNYNLLTFYFQLGKKYHMIFQQFELRIGEYFCKVEIDEEILFSGVNSNAQIWDNVKVYASDHFDQYDPFDAELGILENMIVKMPSNTGE